MNPSEDVHIGSLKVYLQSLAYNIELMEQLDIIDYQSEQIGVCNVSGRVMLVGWTMTVQMSMSPTYMYGLIIQQDLKQSKQN